MSEEEIRRSLPEPSFQTKETDDHLLEQHLDAQLQEKIPEPFIHGTTVDPIQEEKKPPDPDQPGKPPDEPLPETQKQPPRDDAHASTSVHEPPPPILPKWRCLRHVEIFFTVSALAILLALYSTNPVKDDYSRFFVKPVPPSLSSTTAAPELDDDYDTSNASDVVIEAATEKPGLEKFQFRLTYIIMMFTLIATILEILFLDIVSRYFGEPINKFPMILLLSVSEMLCLVVFAFSLDIIIGAFNGLAIAVVSFTFSLSICFATDIIYTFVKGNR